MILLFFKRMIPLLHPQLCAISFGIQFHGGERERKRESVIESERKFKRERRADIMFLQ